MTKREGKFQHDLIQELTNMFPGCLVLKNDAGYLQGMCDLIILFKNRWAALECKRSSNEPFRPNQEHYIEQCNTMSFGRCIYPENKQEVLDELQQALRPRRKTRVARRE